MKGYAANTSQGAVRNYNEDRVSIILNIMQPKEYKGQLRWPASSFFAVYDGHGGTPCADYLRDKLHQFVVKDKNFPGNPKQAIVDGFARAEQEFQRIAVNNGQVVVKSGSCAVVALIVGNPVPLIPRSLIHR